jgi:formylglycine-generating enzyme required for sulfatase activity
MFAVEPLWRMLEGQVIRDQYHLQQLLGAGTYGGVFRTDEVVRDTCLRSLATKLISLQNPDQIAAQLQELQVALNLDHPNLLRCYGAGEAVLRENAFLYLLMELAEGTLQRYLTEQKTLSPEELAPIVRDVAAGLACLHGSQQLHLDIKPANILKVGDAKGTAKAARWKIGDYGLVRSLNPSYSHDVTRGSYGTPLYVPPESYQGILSPAWDIWSLGIMAVILLTGQYPIRYQTEAELSDKIRTGQFDNMQWDSFPPLWQTLIRGCLQVNRGDRWTAEQVLEALSPQSLKTSLRAFTTIIEELGEGISLELIQLPAGKFMMGAPDNNDPDAREDEKPQHLVMVKAFAIGKYPITQAQYEAIVGQNPSRFKGWLKKGNPKYPVENVSWDNAKDFCEKLSRKTGKKYRLPSEAEWEYACKADTITRYYFGNDADQLKDYAWYDKNSYGKTHPVGDKQPNGWALYDMYGNIWEWCEDTWHKNYQGAPDDGTPWIDNNETRVLRGGCWFSEFSYCRPSSRMVWSRDWYDKFIKGCQGFRVVVSL